MDYTEPKTPQRVPLTYLLKIRFATRHSSAKLAALVYGELAFARVSLCQKFSINGGHRGLRWRVHINYSYVVQTNYIFSLTICNNSVSRGLGAAVGGSHGIYLCIKEVTKDRGLHVA